MNSSFQSNTNKPRSYEGQYSTDVMAQKAYSLLDEAVHNPNEKPFFLTIAPVAPHADIQIHGSILDPNHVFEFSAPVSAKRHQNLFRNLKVPRTSNFNPDFVSPCFHPLLALIRCPGTDLNLAIWGKLASPASETK